MQTLKFKIQPISFQFVDFCIFRGEPDVAVITIDSSKTHHSLVAVEVQSQRVN